MDQSIINLISGRPSPQEPSNSSGNNLLSTEVLLDKEQFAVCIAALGITDLDQFKNFLTVQRYISDLDLTKYVNQAYNDASAMWQVALPYLDLSQDDLHSMLSGSQSSRLTDYFRAVKNLLWEYGLRSYDLGFSNVFTSTGYDDIDNVMQDLGSYRNSAALWKISAMQNAYKALSKLFPMGYSGTGDKETRSQVGRFLSEFSEGRLDCLLRGSLKYPKEMGLILPHTLPPQEWIARVLTDLFRKLCNYDRLFLVFRRENADVTRFDPDQSDYILADFDDYPSPYDLDHHPSIQEDSYDEDGKWKWRRVVRSNTKLASAENGPTDNLSGVVEDLLLNYAISRYSSSGIIYGDDYIVTDDNDPKNLFLRFYRRGLSKMDEVNQNPSYLHVISAAVAQNASSSKYVKVLLADYNSVLLIPTQFWNNLGRSESAVRPYGMVVPRVDCEGVRLIVFLSQFALTHQFLSALRSGKPFDFDGATKNMIGSVAKSSALRALKGWNAMQETVKQDFLTSMFKATKATSYGLVATAERNKIGTRTQRYVNQNRGFIQFATPDDEDSDNDEASEFLVDLLGRDRISVPNENSSTSVQDVVQDQGQTPDDYSENFSI